ncbi:MAG TPA: ribosome recycling factor [Longimicrobiaceae bacterium]|nr:ribosome recycling factor [Longimicrobiaceae bacterium]
MPTLKAAGEKMDKAVEALRREFTGVRTGKATPALLDTVRVDAYGSHLPLNQVATVSAPEPRLLLVQPWDRSMLGPVEKAIQASDLGLNPSNDGKLIRVPIPALTEERRKEYARLLHKMAEEARVSVRHARKEANDEIKQRQKDGDLSEDDARRETDEVQKLTDRHIQGIDELLRHKEAEVMEV